MRKTPKVQRFILAWTAFLTFCKGKGESGTFRGLVLQRGEQPAGFENQAVSPATISVPSFGGADGKAF